MWYEPLLQQMWRHYLTHHKNVELSVLSEEMNFAEQYLLYSKFKHASREYLCCQFCDYEIEFTVNYDLTTLQEQ